MDEPTRISSRILVTGGAGFIGVNFIRYLFSKACLCYGRQAGFQGIVVNYDKLTYAGNLMSLKDIDENFGGRSYFFERGDIRDYGRVKDVFLTYDIDTVVHFAAETHVDRSIYSPRDFIETNVNGTFNLLEAARECWGKKKDVRFHHVSTDEVYGSLSSAGYFYETTSYSPGSPYSASKAASDHLVRAHCHTYGLPVTISNCSNNYGPYQFPEKLIPLMILNAVEGKPLPVYGDGKNIRDWLFVEDHCEAVWLIINNGRVGETYNVGGECEKENLNLVNDICDIINDILPAMNNSALGGRSYRELIAFVKDRPGHDRRYAVNCDKLKKELGWSRRHDFETALRVTVAWYLDNAVWVEAVKSGDYMKWVEKNYNLRG